MPLILGANSVSGGYEIDNSLRFNSGSSDYLNRTLTTPTNNKIFTWSSWIKRANIGTSASQNIFRTAGGTSTGFRFADTSIDGNMDGIRFFFNNAGGGDLSTTQKFRDVSAWYHLVVAVDTTQATASNRVKMYINGSQITAFNTATYPSQNYNPQMNSAIVHRVGYHDTGEPFDGYMSDIFFIDGQALTPSSFGETDEDTGIWKPKAFSGSYGTNGFYLQFKNSASLGTDSSGNGNTFTVNNLTSLDQSTDTPTNNFATWNPLWVWNDSGTIRTPTYTDGNLISVFDDGGNNEMALSTFGASVGKWYAEIKCNPYNGFYPANTRYGILDISYSGTTAPSATAYIYQGNGQKRVSNTASSYGNTYTTGDIIGIAMDLDNGYLYFSKNGTFQNSGVPTSGATGTGGISISTGVTYGIYSEDFNFSQNGKAEANFGSPPYSANSYTDGAGYGNFSYAVPSGYYALNTKNLAQFG